MNPPNASADTIMKAVKKSDFNNCMRSSARQARQISDTTEQDLRIAQQCEAVVALRGILVHHHDAIKEIIDRHPQSDQRLQTVRVTALPDRREHRIAKSLQ